MKDPTLQQIVQARAHGKASDKWSSYLPIYDVLFAEFRYRPVRVLEIGVQNGGSLEIWAHYFKNARAIVGVDILDACAALDYRDPCISVVVGDAMQASVEAVVAKSGNFDIIIDDGSHHCGDIVRTFVKYFRHLENGGIYIAEDLHASYWQEFGGGLYHPYSSIAFFKRLVDVLNVEHWAWLFHGFLRSTDLRATISAPLQRPGWITVRSITFANSLCYLRKEKSSENVLGARLISGNAQPVALLNPQDTFRASTQESNGWSSPGRSEQAFVQLLQDQSRVAAEHDRLEQSYTALTAKHQELVESYDRLQQELQAALDREGHRQRLL